MTEAVWIQLTLTAGSIITTAMGMVVVYLRMQGGFHDGRTDTNNLNQSVNEVHRIVNSQRDVMLEEIKNLKADLTTLKARAVVNTQHDEVLNEIRNLKNEVQSLIASRKDNV